MISKALLTSIVVLAGLTVGAQAELVKVTYDGTIAIGQDGGGLFGTTSNLAGDTVVVVYTFDTTQGTTLASATQNYALGGSLFGNASPAISASITIGGVTQTIGGGYFGVINGINNANYSFQSHEAQQDDSNYVYSSVTAESGALRASITSVFKYTVQSGDTAFGAFQLGDQTYASFAPTSITAVPEPSTWAMMLLGLGALGVAARQRTRANAVHAA
jgi:hypothetical protein